MNRMRSFIMILYLFNVQNVSWGQHDIEIQKQRLISFPTANRAVKYSDLSAEALHILNEINRINVEFGYVKNNEANSNSIISISSKKNINNEDYFYPRPAYHPIHHRHNNGKPLPPTIRQFEPKYVAKQVVYNNMQMIPSTFVLSPGLSDIPQFPVISNPFYTNTYIYSAPFSPNFQSKESFQANPIKTHLNDISDSFKTEHQLLYTTRQSKTKTDQDNLNVYHLDDTSPQVNHSRANGNSNETKSDDFLNIVVVTPVDKSKDNSLRTLFLPQSKVSVNNQTRTIFSIKPASRVKQQMSSTPTIPVPTPTNAKTSYKFPLNIFGTTSKSPLTSAATSQQENFDAETKHGPLANLLSNQQGSIVEALKAGGIIIQRLRVRQGGIAIAGPGGVATAGSGGTAIVGPGGIALTHPRSLSIVGPGGRVVSVPKTTDLQDLALRSSARDLKPLAGMVVATGPVIYYNP